MGQEEDKPHSINEPPGSEAVPIPPSDPPVIDALSPDSCAVGDPDFTLYVSGTGLSADSVICFAGYDEPTTYDEVGGTVLTGIKPSLWTQPVTVDCSVHNGEQESNVLQFEFMAAAGG